VEYPIFKTENITRVGTPMLYVLVVSRPQAASFQASVCFRSLTYAPTTVKFLNRDLPTSGVRARSKLRKQRLPFHVMAAASLNPFFLFSLWSAKIPTKKSRYEISCYVGFNS